MCLVDELKSWCLSKLENMEDRCIKDLSTMKLHRSSSVAEGRKIAAKAEHTMLPAEHERSTEATQLHSCGGSNTADDRTSTHYFVVHLDSSPVQTDGDTTHKAETTAPAASAQVVRPKERPVTSAATQRKNQDLQDLVTVELEISSRQKHRTSTPPASTRLGSSRDGKRGHASRKHCKKHLQGRTKSREAAGVRTPDGFGNQPGGATFAQERDNMHAMEVTQCFFEAVLTQIERWYEQKVQEAQQQAEQRAQADRAALMERISCLEDELHLLRTTQ